MEFIIEPEDKLINYQIALEKMLQRVVDIKADLQDELFWLLQHEHVYTGGVNATVSDILNPNIQIFSIKRGGKYTYHGPGQLVGYIMMDTVKWNQGIIDLRKFIYTIEKVIIDTLNDLGISGFVKEGLIGIWINHQNADKKIAAIGVHISRGISSHGFALNVKADISYFKSIVPCGLSNDMICSISDFIPNIKINEVTHLLLNNFKKHFVKQ